jgi:glycosyltransferase involved in cell wall biosynthesis
MGDTLAFIDHSFHKKTKTAQFFTNLLSKYYEVKILWDDSWKNGSSNVIEYVFDHNFDTVIFWQNFYYTNKILKKLNNNNIIIIPMYDGVPHDNNLFWYPYRHFKILNFSRTLHTQLKNLGISSFHVQYYPEPKQSGSDSNGFSTLNGFFWQRRCEITWDLIRKLICNNDFNKFHIHYAIDPPGFTKILPTDDEMVNYHITTSEWFPNNDDYIKLLHDTNVYFAPRPYEGIGMSFLEAMALGNCVVAPNNPTMNEYITNGYNGYLYDLKNPLPLNFSNAQQIAQNAKNSIKEGYDKWLNCENNLIEFINQRNNIESKKYCINTTRFSNFLSVRTSITKTLIKLISYHMRTRFPKLYNKLATIKNRITNQKK